MKSLKLSIAAGVLIASALATDMIEAPVYAKDTAATSQTATALSSIDRELFSAVALSDKKAIKSLLKQGANINASDEHGRTPLLVAIQTSPKSSISKMLIKAGADVTVQDNAGSTAMHYAVQANTGRPPYKVVNGSRIIRALIKAGAYLDTPNAAKQRPRQILLDDKRFAQTFSSFANPESIRRSRLSTLEDHMVARGLISEKTYRTYYEFSLGNMLANAIKPTGQVTNGGSTLKTRQAGVSNMKISNNSLSLSDLTANMKYSTVVSKMKQSGFIPYGCPDRNYVSANHPKVTYERSFRQEILSNTGRAVSSSKWAGIDMACFKKTSTQEHIEARFVQFPDSSRIYFLKYRNFDETISSDSFRKRIFSRYSRGFVDTDFGSFIYRSNDGSELKASPNIRQISLFNKSVRSRSYSLIRDQTAKEQARLDSRKDIKTTF